MLRRVGFAMVATKFEVLWTNESSMLTNVQCRRDIQTMEEVEQVFWISVEYSLHVWLREWRAK